MGSWVIRGGGGIQWLCFCLQEMDGSWKRNGREAGSWDAFADDILCIEVHHTSSPWSKARLGRA